MCFINFLQLRKISDLHDILYCHTCKINPSIIADFDFTLPEIIYSGSANFPFLEENPSFSGLLQMYLPPDSFILEKHVDLNPVRTYI